METVICEVCGSVVEVKTAAPEEQPAPQPQEGNEILAEILLNTQEQCTMMDALIRNQIQVKDEQINKLHSELQFYKDDHSSRFVNQVMKAIIKVRKDMQKRATSPDWVEMSAAEVQREYEYVLDDLTDLLQQQNVDPYETQPGEPFDAARHQAQKIEITDDPALDKCVKRSVSEGYTKGDKVFIVERVVVWQYKPAQTEES